jgi:hypothetical protein
MTRLGAWLHYFSVAATAATACAQTVAPTSQPPRLRRAESFLGVHFDFHARAVDRDIGRHTTRAMVENIIDQVHPDYIQIDCKGHFGFSSYPTKVGNPAPSFSNGLGSVPGAQGPESLKPISPSLNDPLAIWRQVTAERGVALYMHYSGVADQEAIRLRPDWSALDSKGTPYLRSTSLFGPYVDQLMLPQLRELADRYHVDGAWIDGDCWAAMPDYSAPAAKAFRDATGLTDLPKKMGEPHWLDFINFHREAFRRYLRHYTTEIRRTNPNFQIASNWAFSNYMPEPVSAEVDFLSGDYSTQNSVNSARFTARTLESQGKPWDLMAWAFVQGKVIETNGTITKREPGNHLKSLPQLEQEAAIVLARGGGFQCYFNQQADGSIYEWQMPTMAAVAKFCRERQAISHRAVAVPQIAVLYSTTSHYRQSSRVFAPASPTVTAVRGVLQSLLDSQFSVEVLSEHHLHGRMRNWPVIVVPESEFLEPAFRDELAAYVRDGGNLVLVGPQAAAHFKQEIGFKSDPPAAGVNAYLANEDRMAGMLTRFEIAQLPPEAKSVGRLYRNDNPRQPPDIVRDAFSPAASITALGRGRIAVTFVNFGERYLNARTALARDFVAGLIKEIYPKRTVEVTGSHSVDVSLMRQGEKLTVHLVNTAGPHENQANYVFDEIPAVGPLAVRIRTAKKPTIVTLEPGKRPLAVRYDEGVLSVTVPRLAIHEVVVVEP